MKLWLTKQEAYEYRTSGYKAERVLNRLKKTIVKNLRDKDYTFDVHVYRVEKKEVK